VTKLFNPMNDLYRKLASFGLPRAWVKRNILPSWWDDEAALSPSGFAEALLHVSRTAGLDLASLNGHEASAQPISVPARFKHRTNVKERDLEVAKTLACQLARTVAVAAPSPVAQVVASAAELREQLLEPRGWIDLPALVQYCWSIGIPVLQTTNFPAKAKKPDALAVDVGGRKVIVLTTGRTGSPWLLFLVAHELGHVALGHVQPDSALVDSEVRRDDTDADEVAANAWAVTLLSGKPDTRFHATAAWPTAHQLAADAQRLATPKQTDPGFIVLNYAYSMGKTFFAVANAALKLMPETARGDETIRAHAREKLDWSLLGEDAAEFAARMLEAPDEDKTAALAS